MFFYLLTIVIFLGIWYKTYYGYRLFFFGFVLLALVVAYTIDFINKKFPRIRLVILLLLIAVILSNFFAYLVIYRAALPTLLLQKPIDNILYERVQIAEVDDYINTNTSEDAKILLANDVRGYYIERNYVWGDPMNSLLYVDYRTIKNSEQLYITLKKLGITHIRITLFSQYNYTYGFVSEYYGKHVTELYSELFHDYSILVYEKNNVLLYELK
jgi:hypothetical protein